MALRGRRQWLAIDGLGGPSYHSATPDRLQYSTRVWHRELFHLGSAFGILKKRMGGSRKSNLEQNS